jgi:universal stress protein A
MKKITRILVPTDLSPLSAEATEYAKILAKTFRANLFVTHVFDLSMFVVGAPDNNFTFVELWPELENNAKRDLKEFVSKNFRGSLNVEAHLLRGNPHDELVRFAKEKRCDLIVMATHGRTGLAQVVGSVAERVARHSTVPILLIKPEQMKRELPRRQKTKHSSGLRKPTLVPIGRKVS